MAGSPDGLPDLARVESFSLDGRVGLLFELDHVRGVGPTLIDASRRALSTPSASAFTRVFTCTRATTSGCGRRACGHFRTPGG